MPTASIESDPILSDGGADPPDNDDDNRGDDDNDDGDPIRWETVATYWQSAEAHIARLKLESEEIDCLLTNENIVALGSLYAPMVGGIRLQVPEPDASRARALLAEHAQTHPLAKTSPSNSDGAKSASPAADGFDDDLSPASIQCPECGSTEVDRPWIQVRTVWAAIVALMLTGTVFLAPFGIAGFIYYFVAWRPYRCRACGNSFPPNPDPQGFPLTAQDKFRE